MRTKTDFDRQNQYNKSKYDSITMQVPKGCKELWQEEAKKRNLSLTAFVVSIVSTYIAQNPKETSSNEQL